ICRINLLGYREQLMAKRPPCPPGTSWLSPYLTVKDSSAALEFYQKAFGFEKRLAMPSPDGRLGHVEMTWHDSLFMFSPEGMPGTACKAPATTSVRSPVSIYVYCNDVDALYARATKAGATGEASPQDAYWGDRICKLVDPDGHLWTFATNVADFDP